MKYELRRFSTRKEAEEFCQSEHEAGNLAAFVSTLNSHMMTSADTPCVVNARKQGVDQ